MKVLFLLLFVSLIQAELVQVFSVGRHGVRQHRSEDWDGYLFKDVWSQLTSVGMRGMQNLGKIIRKEYIEEMKFLSPILKRQEIEAFATRTDRTIMSLMCLLYGLYPPPDSLSLEEEKFDDLIPKIPKNVNRKWIEPPYIRNSETKPQLTTNQYALPHQFIPRQVKIDDDIIPFTCPMESQYERENKKEEQKNIEQLQQIQSHFIERMEDLFDVPINRTDHFYQLSMLYDAVHVDKYLGHLLPEGFTDDDYLQLRRFTDYIYNVECSHTNFYRYNAYKAKKVIHMFDQRILQGQKFAPKWTFEIGHETDVIALYQALNISSIQCQLARLTEDNKEDKKWTECEQLGHEFSTSVIIQLHRQQKPVTSPAHDLSFQFSWFFSWQSPSQAPSQAPEKQKNEGLTQDEYFVKVRSNGRFVKLFGTQNQQIPYSEFRLIFSRYAVKNIDEICFGRAGQKNPS